MNIILDKVKLVELINRYATERSHYDIRYERLNEYEDSPSSFELDKAEHMLFDYIDKCREAKE